MKKFARFIRRLFMLPMALIFGVPEGTPDGGTQQPDAGKADPAAQSGASAGNSQQPNLDEIFRKLDAVLDQRTAGLAKSALKDNGVADDEIKGIVDAYRADKQRRADEQTQQMTDLRSENAQLKAQIAASKLQAAASAAAVEMGVDPSAVSYVIRLAEMSDALDEKGEPDKEKVTAALKKVLDDIPALKTAARGSSGGFSTVGAPGASGDPASDADARIRKAFGLK